MVDNNKFKFIVFVFFSRIISLLAQNFVIPTINSQLCNLANYQCGTSLTLNYRTINGSCNNLIKPWIGTALSPFKRLNNLQPLYADQASNPRVKAASGKPLPAARQVAMQLTFSENRFASVTIFHVQYGQMIAHDLSNSPQPQDITGRNMQCYCNSTDPYCMILPTTSDDIIDLDQPCMSIPRTISTNFNWQCQNISFKEQLNKLTSWLDMTHIYGFNAPGSARLRDPTDSGFLLTRKIPGLDMPVFPTGASGANQCMRDTVNFTCFQSGEGRTNENMALAGIQVLFLRQHNLIAKILKTQNGWTGSQLYHETKKILTGFHQHIIYNEWLSLIIGPAMMSQFNLNPGTSGYSSNYQSTLAGQIINEFATAAFRYGHGMVPDQMFKADYNLNTFKTVNLSVISFAPQEGYIDGGLDAMLRGTLTNPALMADNHFGDQLQNHLFDVGVLQGNTLRNSLSAFNIQRGRDHGLKPYNAYRSSCNLSIANNFQDLLTNMSPESVNMLQNVYANVNDIDLYVGGLFENLLPGAIVGQTFAS